MHPMLEVCDLDRAISVTGPTGSLFRSLRTKGDGARGDAPLKQQETHPELTNEEDELTNQERWRARQRTSEAASSVAHDAGSNRKTRAKLRCKSMFERNTLQCACARDQREREPHARENRSPRKSRSVEVPKSPSRLRPASSEHKRRKWGGRRRCALPATLPFLFRAP
jgi:hypothetical protein